MNFRLEPHHVPSGCTVLLDAPADAVFSLLWKGREREVRLRWVRWKPSVFLLFLRVEGQIGVATQQPNSPSEAPMKWKQPQYSPRKLLSLARAIERGRNLNLSRSFFCAADEEPQCIMRHRDGKGVWLSAELQTVGEFTLAVPSAAVEDFWKAAFFAAFGDESSEVNFAWRWARMNEEERYAWFFDGSDGLKAQEHLVRIVLQSADELWEEHALVSWRRGLSAGEGWFYDERHRRIREPQLPLNLERWRHFINAHAGQNQWKAADSQRFVRYWLIGKQKMRSFDVEVPRPSAHERLEARLELRDWLEQNVSPQRRRWLLPP